MDYWQLCGTFAAVAFTVGFIDQLRTTYQTRNVDGLSLIQWLVFVFSSGMFTAYYTHLQQWMMVSVSVFGMVCCTLIVMMIMKYRQAV